MILIQIYVDLAHLKEIQNLFEVAERGGLTLILQLLKVAVGPK